MVVIVEVAMMVFMLVQFKRKVWLTFDIVNNGNGLWQSNAAYARRMTMENMERSSTHQSKKWKIEILPQSLAVGPMESATSRRNHT